MQTMNRDNHKAKEQSDKKTYLRYSRQMRLRLIKFVDEEKLSTAEAARIIGIKQTSACRIMKSYHHHNKIFERKADRLKKQADSALEDVHSLQKLQNIITKPSASRDRKQLDIAPEQESIPKEQKQSSISQFQVQKNKGQGFFPQKLNIFFQPVQNFVRSYYQFYIGGVWDNSYSYQMY